MMGNALVVGVVVMIANALFDDVVAARASSQIEAPDELSVAAIA